MSTLKQLANKKTTPLSESYGCGRKDALMEILKFVDENLDRTEYSLTQSPHPMKEQLLRGARSSYIRVVDKIMGKLVRNKIVGKNHR